MARKVLIVGGTGFIGPHLARRLLDEGARVRVVSRRGAAGLDPWKVRMLEGAEIGSLDMTDIFQLSSAMDEVDTVVHAASVSKSRNSDLAMEQDIDVNLKGTLTIMRAAGAAKVRRVVYLSSAGTVYGQGADAPYAETDACVPISSYGIVKLAAENYVSLLGGSFGVSSLILRVSNPLGAGQTGADGQGIAAVFYRLLMKGAEARIFGDGLAERDYLRVEDAMRAACELMKMDAEGIYNIASGRSFTILDVVEALEAATGRTLARTSIKPSRPADVGHIRVDVSKAEGALGWRPDGNLKQIIADYVAWADKHIGDAGQG
ncbi:MAG: SDR family NAD(P)-dependent oxidoreductase [Pseudomonadota bacterium]